jgi:hypothetical protein
MRTRIALTTLAVCSCVSLYAQNPKSPLEGTWEMTSAKWQEGDKVHSFPGDMSGSQVKTYSAGHFLFVGQFKTGEKVQDNYGGGTYALNGEDYAETLRYHVAPAAVGKTLRFKLVIQGNTMTLTGPINPQDQKALGNQLTEVYLRKD